jgi:hypothetical protein
MEGLKKSFLPATARTDQEGLIAVHAQHDDAHVGIAFDDLGGGIDTIELGHGNVHDDNVGGELLGEANGFAAVAGLSNNFDGGVRLEQKLEAFADYAVIIGNKYFGGGMHREGLLHHLSADSMVLISGNFKKKSFVFCLC